MQYLDPWPIPMVYGGIERNQSIITTLLHMILLPSTNTIVVTVSCSSGVGNHCRSGSKAGSKVMI